VLSRKDEATLRVARAGGVPNRGGHSYAGNVPSPAKIFSEAGMPYALIIVKSTSKPFRKKRDQKSID